MMTMFKFKLYRKMWLIFWPLSIVVGL